MVNCNDCWCEHYDKNKGICDQCIKSETEGDRPDLHVIIKRRAVEQMDLEGNNRNQGQTR
jgi:hypothetical protein